MIISLVKASVRLLLLLTFSKCLVYAITPESRGESERKAKNKQANNCETASQAILGNVFIALDLTQDMNVKDMESTWVQHPDVGPNSYFGFTAVPDQNIIFMDGGIGAADSGTTPARFKTTTYNIVTKTWADNLPARDGAMVRSHMATLGQDNNTVYVWGGYRDQVTGLPAGSGYQIPLEMYMYDVKVELTMEQWKSSLIFGSNTDVA
ncbi:hypothetical protein INT45_004058 [Circinella minor]|uniref:Galactose oxidase n=1 Tax=Circinella minor TaxID=1195481 RepID=A0A8H7S294_9FUNG|nr:hypothetical protein INT45_004058 [Circinella minor]